MSSGGVAPFDCDWDCDWDWDCDRWLVPVRSRKRTSLPTTVTSGSHRACTCAGRSAISSPWARTSRAVSSARSM